MGTVRLARMGFADPERAERVLALAGLDLIEGSDDLVEAVAAAPDPDQALSGLTDLLGALAAPEDREALLDSLRDNPGLRRRLLLVLGASPGLGLHLVRHPQQWRDLLEPRPSETVRTVAFLEAVGADPAAVQPIAMEDGDSENRLRVAYFRSLLHLAALDLEGSLGVEEVAAELADLAASALEAALAVARRRVSDAGDGQAAETRLSVIGLGKIGGRELNYVSDVDVLFVVGADSQVETATRLAAATMRICSEHTAEGTLWPVDAGLRPEGRNGPLVRTLASHLVYYERWAKTWEFQALLKARPVAGDRGLGAEFVAAVSPLVWAVADTDGFVDDVHAMRKRVIAHIPPEDVDRELKLGPGGLRDVEFAVQLLQLVHGRADETIRSPTTLTALAALTSGGYVGREDGAAMADAYRFLRTLEHRIQLTRLRRTHLMPTEDRELRALGRSLGHVREPIAELTAAWRRHNQEVRRLHEKLFYRPLLAAVARIPGDEIRLSPEAARKRLAALGYADPAAALRHIDALTAGVSRRAAIQRTLLPAMLEWFADAPDPDAGLLAFRQVSDDLGATPWYLRLLRDEGLTAKRLAQILASSRYVVDLIRRAPSAIEMLGTDSALVPRPRAALETEMAAAAERYKDNRPEAVAAIRAIRRRELFRIAAADVLDLLPVDDVVAALSGLAYATLSAVGFGPGVAVVAMGRLGGYETTYASDADVLFVGSPETGPAVTETRRLLAEPSTDPPFVVDASLRPEGKSGPLVRTVESYATYYARWSHPWEAQALLRAAPLTGDPATLEAFTALIDPLRYPADGLSENDVREIRRIKARVDAERLPRGADPTTHTKLGRGGLADVEWTVQLLQLRHAGAIAELRTTRTVEALDAATEAGLIAAADRTALVDAWRLATRTRNAIVLVRGRPSDSLPHDPRELASIARILGYDALETGRFLEDYRRTTRLAHEVVDRIFWS